MADLRQITKLRDAGVGVARPRDVKHILSFETSETAGIAADLLQAVELSAFVSRASEGSGWWVTVSARHALSIDVISVQRTAFEALARDLDGTYLGWGPGGDGTRATAASRTRVTRRETP